MQTIITSLALEHIVLPIVLSILTALITWAVTMFRRWTGIEIEAKHREALQSALENGVRYAMNKLATGGVTIDLRSEEWREKVIREAADYLEESVPDALSHFGIWGVDQLRRLLLPKLPVLTDAEALDMNNAVTGLNQTHIPTR